MEFDEIVIKGSPGLCRCCLSEGCYKDLSTEYTWMDDNEVYAEMLLECFDISISQHNEGPNGPNRLICEVCITRLRDACNFKKQVLASEKKFVDMVGRGAFKSKVVVYQAPIKVKTDIEESHEADVAEIEYLEDDMDFGDGDLLKDDDAIDQSLAEDITVETLPVKGKRGRPRKNALAVQADKRVKLPKTEEKPKASKAIAKGAYMSAVEDKCKRDEMARKLSIKRRNVEYVLQYSNVTPFTWHKGRYRCFYCSEPMKEPEVLREHTAKVHQFANLELVVYDRTRYNRNREAAVKIDVTGITCKLCSKPVKDLEQLIHHLIIAHDAEYDLSVPNCLLPFKLDRDQLACSICDMKFVFFEYLLRHANKLHLSHDYICDVCGTSFQGENHLKMHHRYYHREGGYPCDHCGITLATLSKKILHEKNIHMVNLSTCPHCPETFKSPYFKKLHLANVHGVEELRFKCPQCPRVFPQESIMSRHMRRVHLREKNVECEVCGDRFFGPYDVKLHMMKHNGDKKFVCAVCGKRFSKKTNLNTHSATHMSMNEGKRQLACHVCGKIFVHKPNLKMHYRTVHPEFGDNVDLDQSAGISDLDTEIVHMDFVQDAHLTAEYIH